MRGSATASRPTRSSTSARTARSNGSTARTSASREDDAPDALIVGSARSLHLQRRRRRRRARGPSPRHGDARRSHGAAVQEGRAVRRAGAAQRNDQRLRASARARIRSSRRAYAERIREQVITLGIAKDLGLNLDKPGSLERRAHSPGRRPPDRAEGSEHSVRSARVRPHAGRRRCGRRTIDAIVSVDRSPAARTRPRCSPRRWSSASSPRVRASWTAWCARCAAASSPTGGGGEPIRNPDSYPTGKNFYGIDPDKVPKPASWEHGRASSASRCWPIT